MNAQTTLHFLELAFQAEEQEFLPTAVQYLHSFNAKNDNALGVDLRGWSAGSNFQGAPVLRVLGTAQALKDFTSQPKLSRLATLCGLSLKVCAVPVTAELVSVTRDNRSDKAKPAYARRLARRLAERTGAPVLEAAPRWRHASEASVSLTSQSNKQNFLLRLKKRTVQVAAPAKFNAYGLCIAGGIPQF
jgi:CRISPR-associated endoribonuclease Cas6/Csy4 subtype I-F